MFLGRRRTARTIEMMARIYRWNQQLDYSLQRSRPVPAIEGIYSTEQVGNGQYPSRFRLEVSCNVDWIHYILLWGVSSANARCSYSSNQELERERLKPPFSRLNAPRSTDSMAETRELDDFLLLEHPSAQMGCGVLVANRFLLVTSRIDRQWGMH